MNRNDGGSTRTTFARALQNPHQTARYSKSKKFLHDRFFLAFEFTLGGSQLVPQREVWFGVAICTVGIQAKRLAKLVSASADIKQPEVDDGSQRGPAVRGHAPDDSFWPTDDGPHPLAAYPQPYSQGAAPNVSFTVLRPQVARPGFGHLLPFASGRYMKTHALALQIPSTVRLCKPMTEPRW